MRTDTRHLRSAGVGRRFGVVVLAVTFAIVTVDIGAQRADQRDAPPNFDVRTARDAAATEYMARFASLPAFFRALPTCPVRGPQVWPGCRPTSGRSM